MCTAAAELFTRLDCQSWFLQQLIHCPIDAYQASSKVDLVCNVAEKTKVKNIMQSQINYKSQIRFGQIAELRELENNC